MDLCNSTVEAALAVFKTMHHHRCVEFILFVAEQEFDTFVGSCDEVIALKGTKCDFKMQGTNHTQIC